MGTFLAEEDVNVEAGGGAGRVVVGRGCADRGARVAGRFGGVGCAVARPGVVGADRGVLGVRGGGGPREREPWASDDRDRDLRALDGDQAPHGLGVRDAGTRGLRLAAPAALLSDRARRARAGGVDGPQTDASVGWRGA